VIFGLWRERLKMWHRHSCLCALGRPEPSVHRLIPRGAHRQECLCHTRQRRTLWIAATLVAAVQIVAPAYPSQLIAGNDRVAVIDGLHNDVRVIQLASRHETVMRVNETPVDGVFVNDTLYILERDARALERIGADGTRASLTLAADPAFLRIANRKLYAYSRLEGIVQEIDLARFTITRSVRIAPFASDFETDGRTGYLVRPRDAKISTFSIATMKPTRDIKVGAVPTDLAISGHTLAIADPSAKKLWVVEGNQSMTQAIARGFIRGLLGLGLYSNRTSQFPTGIDRVVVRGSTWLAYDSSSGTLYRVSKSKSSVLAKDIPPQGFAITSDAILVLQNGAVRRLQQ